MRHPTTRLLTSLLTLLLLAAATMAAPVHAHGEPGVGEIDVALTITAATVVPRTGIVTVAGTVRCSEDGTAHVGVEVVQRVGRFHTIGGWGQTEVACGPTASRFTVALQETSGAFKPGKMRIRAFAESGFCDPDTWECRFGHDDVDLSMRVRRG